VPTLAINILSKSTLANDIGINMDFCRLLGIPLYVLFNPYLPEPRAYKAPFLRVYRLTGSGDYEIKELREITMFEGGAIDLSRVISVGELVPFMLGILELKQKHKGDLPIYRLMFVNSATGDRLLAFGEQQKMRADQEKRKREEAEQRIKELETALQKHQET
jgi:hypothetical protein